MKLWLTRAVWTGLAAAVMIALANCGGGSEGNSFQPPPPPPPPPPALVMTTTSLPESFYSEFYSVTLEATGGVGARTWSVTSGSLPVGLNLNPATGVISGVLTDEATGPKSFQATVRDTASSSVNRSFDIQRNQRAPQILTTALPNAVIGRPYQVRFATTQPNATMIPDPTVTGTPPPGIILISPQTLSGTPTTQGTFTFGVQTVTTPAAQRTFTITVVGPGAASRNEDTANARSVSNGTYFASISPFVDAATGPPFPNPDHDFYRLTAQPGSTVSIEITAERNTPRSPLDAVIELVDSAGTRLTTCNAPGQSGFASPCMNDDNTQEGTLDSKLVFRAPSGAATTFFLHVLDWRGDARTDMLYSFQVFGAD